ncbi:predicted protein [Lichtheimia corymbifera JMRC:FSU:9682]|uniref:Uncharacterized protein n=1 Tax=Lichtheimia corymbifera JMRC:FSU:9682 TaxID=1263082 RepID=A0A068S9P3_9FUNG|nr:predicted protein [Lichtheimia corymbifera JMRC:FSU:9682]
MDQFTVCMICLGSSTNLNFPALPTPSFFPLPPISSCWPIQVQLAHANDCPASTHHVNPTAVLIRSSSTEWRVHGLVTLLQHPRFFDLHTFSCILLNDNQRGCRSRVTAFIPAVAISKAFISIASKQQHLLAATCLTAFSREQQMTIICKQLASNTADT